MREEQKPIVAWMRGVMDRTGLSAGQWSLKAKLSRNFVTRVMREDYPHITSTSSLLKLANAAKVDLPSGLGVPSEVAGMLPSAEVMEEALREVIDCLAPDIQPDLDVLGAVAEAFRDTLAALVTDPLLAEDLAQARLYARAYSRRLAH